MHKNNLNISEVNLCQSLRFALIHQSVQRLLYLRLEAGNGNRCRFVFVINRATGAANKYRELYKSKMLHMPRYKSLDIIVV